MNSSINKNNFFFIKGLLFFNLLFFSIRGFSQERLSITYTAGRVFLHSKKLLIPSPPYSQKVEIAYQKRLNFGDSTFFKRGHPWVGLNLAYLNYGNKDKLGYVLGIYPSISFEHKKKHKLSYEGKIGLGIGRLSNFYGRNPWNDTMKNAVSQAWNNFTVMSTALIYNINSKQTIKLGASFSHISSGSLIQPNFGINLFGVDANYSFNIKNEKPEGATSAYAKLNNRKIISFGFGNTSNTKEFGARFPIYILKAKWAKGNSKKLAFWQYGVEYNFMGYKNRTTRYYDPNTTNKDWIQNSGFYLTAGREWLISKIGLNLTLSAGYEGFKSSHFGYYQQLSAFYYPFSNQFKIDNPLNNMFVGVGLKAAQFSVAQYFEFSLGTYF